MRDDDDQKWERGDGARGEVGGEGGGIWGGYIWPGIARCPSVTVIQQYRRTGCRGLMTIFSTTHSR